MAKKKKDVNLIYVESKELKKVIFAGMIIRQSQDFMNVRTELTIVAKDMIPESLFSWQNYNGNYNLKVTIEKV